MKKFPALFSYRHCDSLVHRIPAWIKLLLLMAVTLGIFSVGLAGVGMFFAATVVFFFLAKTPFSSLVRLRFILWLALCMVLITLCTFKVEEDHGAYFYSFNLEMLRSDGLYVARFFTTALFALVVFETTSKIQIMDTLSAIENLICKILPPFRKLHFALILSITITFIPEIFSQWNKINIAAASRTPLNKKGRRPQTLASLNAQLTALFMNLLQYAEQVRRAVANRLQ